MFKFLKDDDDKIKVNILIDRPDAPYYPGDDVTAKITIESRSKVKIREARAALVARDMCLYQDDTYTSDFSAPTTNWSSFDREIDRQELLDQGVIAAESTQTFDFSATIPPDASPTCNRGAFVKLNWLVKVTLDRPMAPDVNVDTEFLVLSTPPGELIAPGEFGQSNDPDEAEMAIYLPSKEWVLGDTVDGELRINPQTEFDVTEIRISLAQVETVYQGQGNQYQIKSRIQVAENLKLQPGQKLVYPFSFTIPDDGQVTTNTGSGSISWMVRGVLARPMRPDTYIEEEISVYSTKSAGQ
jgi:sporulation-control protein spo0M